MKEIEQIKILYLCSPVPKPIWYFKDEMITGRDDEYKFDNYGRTLV